MVDQIMQHLLALVRVLFVGVRATVDASISEATYTSEERGLLHTTVG